LDAQHSNCEEIKTISPTKSSQLPSRYTHTDTT